MSESFCSVCYAITNQRLQCKEGVCSFESPLKEVVGKYVVDEINEMGKKGDVTDIKKYVMNNSHIQRFKLSYLKEHPVQTDESQNINLASLFPSVTKEGFIMARHVRDQKSNNFWQHSYDCIRQFYPESNILIIDDNSNYDFITNKELDKSTIVIQSEFPARGEILPYYYYSRLGNKFCDVAICMHDSMFITAHIDIAAIEKYKMLWDIGCHNGDNIGDEQGIIGVYKDKELSDFYHNKPKWTGCFGAASIVSHDFLMTINDKHDIRDMLDRIKTRVNRQSFERVWGAILQYHHNCPYNEKVLIGGILAKCQWLTWWEHRKEHARRPITKIWYGR